MTGGLAAGGDAGDQVSGDAYGRSQSAGVPRPPAASPSFRPDFKKGKR